MLDHVLSTVYTLAIEFSHLRSSKERNVNVYSYFEKGCRKKCARDNPERKYRIWSIHCFLTLQLTLTNRHAWPLVPFFQREKRIILKLGLEWLGGAFSKLLLLKGRREGPYEIVFFWEGKVLIHHAFLKITAPGWDAINNRSLNIIHSEEKEEISRVNILVSIKNWLRRL